MSAFSSFLPSKLLGSMNNRDRPSDPLSRLRFALETMPGSRKYVFTPATRTEIITELYESFWGVHSDFFVLNPSINLPLNSTLHELQYKLGFGNSGKEEKVVPGRACGNIFKKGECCFRCRDCALDDSCVLCSRCFHSTSHVGHNVSFFIAQQSGGCCDCGDFEAWKVSIGCPHHPPVTTETPRVAPKSIGDPDERSIPPELLETMRRTVAYALDFILDTLDYSPDEPLVPANEVDLRVQPSADPMMKDQYCVVLWNDDKHSFDDVIKLLCDTTGRTREEANEVAIKVDDQGREVIDMNANIIRLLETARTFSQIDLGVTVRRAYDTFREQIVVVIIDWLLDITRSRLGTDTGIMREIISKQLVAPRRSGSLHPNVEAAKIVSDVQNPARLDWMFLYHTRLWKKPRLNLKEVYASVLSLSHEHKMGVASHFANVYHRIIDSYLLVDREAETSIKYFALQLFTVPSIALHIVRKHNLINRLSSIITAFFTNQIKDKRIIHPADSNASVDVEAFPFKSKRFMPVFSDLRYLCHNEPVQDLIAHNRDFILLFSKTCQLFMCINPNKRAANSHVEYETDAWISVFNVTLSLSRVIKVYGEAFSRATIAELVAAITTVMHDILVVCTLSNDRLDREKFSAIAFHDVTFGENSYSVVEFDVLEGWVSFHHSLQWLLAELFKHIDILTEDNLKEIGLSSIRDVCLRNASEQAVLTIIDFPLRVLAMIAQIRTGLWVRNGFAIRGQLLHYRDFMLRELCYDQDLFILQMSLMILEPNTVFVSILDRFQLLQYFSGEILNASYEGPHLASMVEEILYVFITIVSEEANASKMTLPEQVRREIVHALAMGPCTYTDLTKRVAERMAEDVCFERVLTETANFKPPEATSDSGIYELKDKAYDEVNPFYFHYTRNRREEVETVLKNRLKKKTGVSDPVIPPKSWSCKQGPFANLVSVYQSEVLLQVMFYSIHNILVLTESSGEVPPSAEAILDQGLQLIMLALTNHGSVFSQLTLIKPFEQLTLLDTICTLEHHEKFKTYKARAEWIIEQFSTHIPEEVQKRRKIDDVALRGPNPDDAKKKAAKARQDAIMKQMKAQQASFAINFNDAEDDEDDEMVDEADTPVSHGTCIVCQEELNDTKVFGALGLIQPSRLIRRHPDGHNVYLSESLSTPISLDRPSPETALDTSFPPPDAEIRDASFRASLSFQGFPNQHTRFGLHSGVCTHMMHMECFHTYHMSIRQRHRAQATRNPPENVSRKEFICPLCKSLGNVMLPVSAPSESPLSAIAFADWIRAAGISILKSKPDQFLDALHSRTGTGEFVFWSAQDSGYANLFRFPDRSENMEMVKMIDTVMSISKTFSQQTRHLRDRMEPDHGDRGAGIYLPEELIGYTVSALEIAQRGSGPPGSIVADHITDPQLRMVRGLVACLTNLVSLQFRGKLEEGKEAAQQAIIKRLLPEWSRTSLTTSSFSHPLLLRDPFTILVETAAVGPEILRHVLILTYYACLARTAIGLIYILTKTRSYQPGPAIPRAHEDLFGDVRVFFMSVVRHSPVFEHAAELAFQAFGEARIERLLYSFTLPFLRRASILCRAMLPSAFPTIPLSEDICEYRRLLQTLDVPALSDLPNQDTLQNALSGWCAHYGQSRATSQMNCGVTLDYPAIYRTARLPIILDNLFVEQERALICPRCNTAPLDAAICMACGTICCMQSHCCVDKENGDRGECNMHTRECGGSIGVYFLVKRCSLLYLYVDKGAFGQPPYLDDHGEIDVSMRRGRRQYLHPARFEELRKIWLNHGIPTLITRKLETAVDNGGWETL